MNLLGTEAFRFRLSKELSKLTESLVVLSAFTTKAGFYWLINNVKSVDVNGKLVVRWRVDDLLSGASDLSIYELAKQHGWNIYIYQDLHAKALLIDQKTVFVGSANLTANGLSLVTGANKELGVCYPATEQDIGIFENVLLEGTLVTDELFDQLNAFVSTLPKVVNPKKTFSWPTDIIKKLEKPPEALWVADMLWATPESIEYISNAGSVLPPDIAHDMMTLGIVGLDYNNKELLRTTFLKSRPWQWLYNQLLIADNNELYFGGISSLLHNAFLDDPGPYRKDVKGLLQNLLCWIERFADHYVKVDIPQHKSQRVKLHL